MRCRGGLLREAEWAAAQGGAQRSAPNSRRACQKRAPEPSGLSGSLARTGRPLAVHLPTPACTHRTHHIASWPPVLQVRGPSAKKRRLSAGEAAAALEASSDEEEGAGAAKARRLAAKAAAAVARREGRGKEEGRREKRAREGGSEGGRGWVGWAGWASG